MRPLRILVLAFGSLGDVVPYIALAAGLRSFGFTTRIVTHATFEPLVRSHGLECAGIRDDPQEILSSEVGRRLRESGSNPLAFALGIRRLLDHRLARFLSFSLAESHGADAILASGLGVYAAAPLAEKLGIPCISAYLQPVTRTADFPNAFVSAFRGYPIPNRLSHFAFEFGRWAMFQSHVNEARRSVLGLPSKRGLNHFPGPYSPHVPVLYGYSPSVMTTPRDWGERTFVTGYWFLPRSRPEEIPLALRDFIASKPEPICIGFGSMTERRDSKLLQIIVEALKRSKIRAVLLTGWGMQPEQALPYNIFAIETVPHDWLFPRVAAVVHHGGAGTTGAALRAGVPSVVIPFFGDQFFWGDLLHRLDAAPPPLPREQLTADALSRAIKMAVTERRLKTAASGLSERIGSEDGIGRAAEILGTLLGG